MSKKAKKPAKPAPLRLKSRTYDKLERLVFWVEAIPDDIFLSEKTWDDVHCKMHEYLEGHLGPEESATVEIGRHDLIAVVEDAQGVERRVPVLPADLEARLERHRRAQK